MLYIRFSCIFQLSDLCLVVLCCVTLNSELSIFCALAITSFLFFGAGQCVWEGSTLAAVPCVSGLFLFIFPFFFLSPFLSDYSK